MEQDNLAAAILRSLGWQVTAEEIGPPEGLTNEEAINLADWLRREPSINAWRTIEISYPSGDGEAPTDENGISSIRRIK